MNIKAKLLLLFKIISLFFVNINGFAMMENNNTAVTISHCLSGKAQLNFFLQRMGWKERPIYVEIPSQKNQVTVAVSLSGHGVAYGHASHKKEAAHIAAKNLLEILQNEEDLITIKERKYRFEAQYLIGRGYEFPTKIDLNNFELILTRTPYIVPGFTRDKEPIPVVLELDQQKLTKVKSLLHRQRPEILDGVIFIFQSQEYSHDFISGQCVFYFLNGEVALTIAFREHEKNAFNPRVVGNYYAHEHEIKRSLRTLGIDLSYEENLSSLLRLPQLFKHEKIALFEILSKTFKSLFAYPDYYEAINVDMGKLRYNVILHAYTFIIKKYGILVTHNGQF